MRFFPAFKQLLKTDNPKNQCSVGFLIHRWHVILGIGQFSRPQRVIGIYADVLFLFRLASCPTFFGEIGFFAHKFHVVVAEELSPVRFVAVVKQVVVVISAA